MFSGEIFYRVGSLFFFIFVYVTDNGVTYLNQFIYKNRDFIY